MFSVRPEHQHLIVGWNGNGIGKEMSLTTTDSKIKSNGDTQI